jgi:hypothetical protein
MNNTPESTSTNHGQVGNAGDAQALGALLVKIQPSLSSLLQDLANWDAARSLPAPNFDKPQETSSLANTSQEDQLEQRDLSKEPSTTDGSKCSIDLSIHKTYIKIDMFMCHFSL